MKHMNIETLMDILDWFDDGLYDYLDHILLTKPDGEARIRRAMPELRKYARSLVAAHRGTDRAGLVLRLPDGSEFQITILQSR